MTRVTSVLVSTLALLLGLLAAPAVAQTPEPPDYVIADPAFEALPGAEAFAGTIDTDGAEHAYRIEVPDDWNGTLVLYAHGFVGPQQEELVVQDPPLRPLFVQQGIAWAASSYAANGYVIDGPVDQTQDLADRFAELTGGDAPTATIIHGFSMGGHITGVALERYPDAYVGALPACGVMGDVELFEYFTDVNLVAGALAGVEVPVPGGLPFLGGPAQQISAALGLQTGLATPAGVQYADVVEALSGGERPTFEESLTFWNTLAAVDLDGEDGDAPTVPFLQALYGNALSAGIPTPVGVEGVYDNAGTIYGFPNATSAEPSPQEQALNAAVARVTNDGEAPFPTIDGTPQVPTLSLHTTGDLFVPLLNQVVYAEEVEANGLSDNLVQRTVRAPGHCDFTAEELGGAFVDLLTWIQTGTAPAGEALIDPAVRADRSLGCAFTSETRAGMPPCEVPVADVLLGGDPVATAIAVTSARTSATTAVLARSDAYADALTGSALAGALGAPLLLNPVESLDPTVLAELQRLGVTDVVLLGGTAALSAAVEQALGDADIQTSRVAGTNRFGTAGAVAGAIAEATGTPTDVFVADGGDFPDAVGVAGLAAFLGQPILLVETDRMPTETTEAMAALGGPAVTVLGGVDAVSAEVAGDAPRLAGDTRYGTSAAVIDASRNAGLRINQPWVATGETFADALVAGPAAAAAGQVMVLVDGGDLEASAETTAVLEGLSGLAQGLTVVTSGEVSDGAIIALETAVRPGEG
ncbi:cell wall-binding repeat-containing protein [Euzebya pacifica]|uniref:cell wall-binding repeat-containing protein n=1 Tax=Euzebya pacifica TaxID=1608957 RepID=UPI0013E0E939|nr:cell wall-binding repeat-containing protein [Euzebya pacifica]